MKNSNLINILISRQKINSQLTVNLSYATKKTKFEISKSDDLLIEMNKILKKNHLLKPKIVVKFKGNVGLLNKRIALAIARTMNLFR